MNKDDTIGLIPMLGHNRGKKRSYAAQRLIEIGMPAVDGLFDALSSPNNETHRNALFVLKKLGIDVVPRLSEGLYAESQEICLRAFKALTNLGDAGTWPIRNAFCSWMNEGCDVLLQRALRILKEVPELPAGLVPELVEILKRDHPALWEDCIAVLALIGTGAEQCLFEVLRTDNREHIKQQSLTALSLIGDTSSIASFVESLTESDRVLLVSLIIDLLRQAVLDKSQPDATKHTAGKMIAYGSSFLIELEKQAAMPLLKIKGDVREPRDFRSVASGIFQDMSDEARKSAVEAILNDADPRNRICAIRGMSVDIGHTLIPHLIEKMGDPEEPVRAAAVEALVRVRGGSLPYLKEVIKSGGDRERLLAAFILGAGGTENIHILESALL